MVILMDALETYNVSEGHCLQREVQQSNTDQINVVLPKLPFSVDISFVYHIEEFKLTLLTSGFFGDIFEAYHRKSTKTMVLKKDKESFDEMCPHENSLMSEAEILSQINHPNVVRFLGLCIDELNNQVHLLIEYVNGGNLEQLLMNHDELLDWGTRVNIARDIADGMSYLHKNRIIHRDLASKNCLIKIVNDVKYGIVADLGLATHLPDNDEGVQYAVGSPYNMAPELLRGERYDSKADVFSYGIIMCEIIGRVHADPDELPRTGSFGLDVEKFQTMVSDCPIEFLHTAICCCQMDPKSRPSFSATVKHLDAILSGYPPRRELFPQETTTVLADKNVQIEYSIDNNNSSSSTCSSVTSNQLLTPTSSKDIHVKTDKRRLSWISGRYKLFHSATDDLLKHTPAKLKGFFKNVLGARSKDHSFKPKKRSNSSSLFARVSPIPTEKVSYWNNHQTVVSPSSSYHEGLSLSKSCPGTSGMDTPDSSPVRRHTIARTTPEPCCNDDHDFPLITNKQSCEADMTSVSSGFDSMHGSVSTVESSSVYTNSEYSSRHSSLRRDPSLPEDDEDPTTTTCKNLKALHFDRFGSYSVIDAETSNRQEIERETRKDKDNSDGDQLKTKRKMPAPRLFSFFLGNRTKTKDQ